MTIVIILSVIFILLVLGASVFETDSGPHIFSIIGAVISGILLFLQLTIFTHSIEKVPIEVQIHIGETSVLIDDGQTTKRITSYKDVKLLKESPGSLDFYYENQKGFFGQNLGSDIIFE